MESINLKDNYQNELEKNEIELLEKTELAGKTLKGLKKDYPNLFIFPQDEKNFKDDIENLKLFTIKDNEVHTGNLMGFIGVDDLLITIRSRFDSDDKQYFSQYMLSKVFAINLVDYKSSYGKDDIWRFLLYFVFVALLKKALRQGLYKEYVWNEYNDTNVKGRINISRHIKQNIPFQGNIAYDVREYSYDNKITQLIRHTIEFIQERNGFKIFRGDEILQNISLIKQSTPTYKKSERQQVRYKNLRPLNQPFFTDYEPLRRVCVEILNYESLAYRESQKRVYGVLFDGAWLWEEYLNTILKKEGFKHPKNKEHSGRRYLLTNGKGVIYPDFYIENEIVLDAKYKKLQSSISDKETKRSDWYQIISYLHVLKAKRGYLIFPEQEENDKKGCNKIGTLNGYGGEIGTYGFAIPNSKNTYKDFVNEISKSENFLIEWTENPENFSHK